MVTHDAEEAMYMAECIAIMKEGKIAQIGALKDLYNAPNSPFIAKFLGDMNEIKGYLDAGMVKTNMGDFNLQEIAPNYQGKDGDSLLLFIRPESLLILADGEKITLRFSPKDIRVFKN